MFAMAYLTVDTRDNLGARPREKRTVHRYPWCFKTQRHSVVRHPAGAPWAVLSLPALEARFAPISRIIDYAGMFHMSHRLFERYVARRRSNV